jgi:hypothetical protein
MLSRKIQLALLPRLQLQLHLLLQLLLFLQIEKSLGQRVVDVVVVVVVAVVRWNVDFVRWFGVLLLVLVVGRLVGPIPSLRGQRGPDPVGP